ncbi:unnamed protein product [Effrenium voratum]|nr:unnamed protein product [Effrenium voratum]
MERFKANSKAPAVTEAVQHCKRLVLSENLARLVLRSEAAVNQWRHEVLDHRHDGSLDAVQAMETPENFRLTEIAEWACKAVPGLRSTLTRQQLQVEGQVSHDLSRPDAAAAYANLLESEFGQYTAFLADLTTRQTASEEELKKLAAEDKEELRRVAEAQLLGTVSNDSQETTNQNSVRGGWCRMHHIVVADLPVKVMPLITAYVRRFAAERSLPLDSVATLVLGDFSGKPFVSKETLTSLQSFVANCDLPCLFFVPAVTPRTGVARVGHLPEAEEGSLSQSDDAGEAVVVALPSSTPVIGTGGTIAQPTKKRRAQLQSRRREFRAALAPSTVLDEDFSLHFDCSRNGKVSCSGFSLEPVSTDTWLSKTCIASGSAGPFPRPSLVVATSKTAAVTARATGVVKQVAPGEASFADRSQKGPLAYQKLFESVIDGLTTSSQKKSSLVVVALEGGVADDGLGVLKAGQSKGQFPVGYLYLERHDHLKGIARARLMSEISELLVSKALTVPGFTPGRNSNQKSKVNVSEEARLFSEGLKVLKLDTEARLVVPSDSDVASSHASASVFSTLATIREKTEKFKVQVGAGDSADAAVTFKSKELFQQRHTVAQVLGFDFCKGLKLLVHSSGCALYNETDSELVVGAKGPTPLIGYGAMSVITSAESEKFGGRKMQWTLTSATAASKVLMLRAGDASCAQSVGSVLEDLKYSPDRPDVALYGHDGSTTANRQLMLKARLPMLAVAGENPTASQVTLANAGLLVQKPSSPKLKLVRVLQAAESPAAPACYLMPRQQSTLFWLCAEKLALAPREVLCL